MDFRSLPPRPDHPRYKQRYKAIQSLLDARQDRLVEDGMWMDRHTADDDFWWFCKRFTSFSNYRVSEIGHPMDGKLWIDHPYTFWLTRLYQELIVEPQEGWTWIKIHRLGLKTTTAIALCLWIHSIDGEGGDYPRWLGLDKTIGLWTHKQDEVGTSMGRGTLGMLQTNRLKDHYPQFRDLQEGTKQGYTVGRPAGAREQSLTIESILTSPESLHPGIYLLDDIITAKLRNNVDQIARIRKNISDIVSLMPPDAPVIVFNTPKDKADPLMEREREGLFARVITQAATVGGDFTGRGADAKPNLHTAKHYREKRRQQNDDSIYFAEYELEFRERAGTLFSWSWMREYEQRPEEVAANSPYVNIIVDGAGGTKGSDFTVIRVITWTAHNAWANLDLIRERIGSSKCMQILLGRDPEDATTEWIERPVTDSWRPYCPGGVGLVEKWLRYDPTLTIWFDDHGNANWRETFLDQCRLRRINFGGKMPNVRAWPEVHAQIRAGAQKKGGFNKYAKIHALEPAYQQGRAAYPRAGFGHGSYNGLAGFDNRDTAKQFREDEFERLTLGEQLPFDDLLDTESLLVLPQAYTQMRRPAEGSGYQLGGVSFPSCTTENPWGLPGGPNYGTIDSMKTGRTWVSLL